MNNNDSASRVGTEFGPYRLVRLLGRGGMGEVYEAEDTRKRRSVALKLITPALSGNPSFRARMQREADAAGRLTEPHVVPIHDYGEIDGQMYVEMRMIDGRDLSVELKRSGPLAPARAVAVIEQVASALDAAHASGITHRDIKPENILLTRDDFAYLVDFGIARAAADPELTQTGMALGTYNYMAPERFGGGDVDYRADIYSLACVLSECLCGMRPYPTETVERLIAAHLMEPAPRPSQLRPGVVPIALDQVIARGMAKNPRERYSSAGDLARAAHDALTTAEQHQAAMILQHGDAATRISGPVGTATNGGGGATGAGHWQPSATGAQHGYPPNAYGHQQDQTQLRPAAAGWPEQPARPQAHAFSAPVPAAPAEPKQRGERRWMVPAAAAAALLIVVGGVVGYAATHRSDSSTSATASAASSNGQSVVAFDGLNFRFSPGGVAVDGDGTIYATNQSMYGRVVKLEAGSTTPVLLPFTGLYEPQGVTVDRAGTVYVTDFNNRVLKLEKDATDQVELPFTGLNYPEGLAVDAEGSVYVTDRGNGRVLKLPAGSDAQEVLPFTGLRHPDDVVIDSAGNIYVSDTDNDRVVKLAAGSQTQTDLPFSDLSAPWGLALDRDGNVYVANHDSHTVVKMGAGGGHETKLPFSGLNTPLQIAVGPDGAVYVADRGNNRVVKLAGA
ncbi:serine/threonine-protein kinase PknD [[Mycobacterium] kokjensenii]|uniref:non-specific serine/threonine protein kinase n=1 Tax=[Mycobacterium] kokjensenii TaxID=3064287 RepID=A0ABN9NBT9_9MYCO|nr:serine/threonine-protein kinase PknD [Mycolicibacter sp. MU0083]CAJ1503795.1 serine/threonine-protein kinase PknD [Mycolicibacter sp. MU0083]